MRRCRLHVLFGLGLSLASNQSLSNGQTIKYVDQNATGLIHNGNTWCNAYLTLQDAISAATSGWEIRVADGVYTPHASDRTATFTLKSGVTLKGGYAGCGAADPSARDNACDDGSCTASILSGDLAQNDCDPFSFGCNSSSTTLNDNSYHVATYSDPNATNVVLDGFVVERGNANGTGVAQNQGAAVHIRKNSFCIGGTNPGAACVNSTTCTGGGMCDADHCIPGGPTLRNCTFRRNHATNHSAVNDHAFSSTIENCIFQDNKSARGAGLLIEHGSPTIKNCTFTRNDATEAGVCTQGTSQGNCCMMNNQCLPQGGTPPYGVCGVIHEGGAIWAGRMANDSSCQSHTASAPVITGCVFNDNRAGDRSSPDVGHGRGGAIWSTGSSLTITDCIFTHNRATSHPIDAYAGNLGQGAAIWAETVEETSPYSFSTNLSISDSTFYKNDANISGGGIYVEGKGGLAIQGDTTVRNCKFIENTSGKYSVTPAGGYYQGGAGIWLEFTNMELEGLFLDRNESPGVFSKGGGLFLRTVLGSVKDLELIGNRAGAVGGGVYVTSSDTTWDNCLFLGNYADVNATAGGGAMFSSPSTGYWTRMRNCTVAYNYSNWNQGGGVRLSGNFEMVNSIVWGNEDDPMTGTVKDAQLSISGTGATITYTDWQGHGGDGAAHIIYTDPVFVDAAGTTRIDHLNDDLRLQTTSPCKNTGNDSAVTTLSDLQGQCRIRYGDVDMGAYEFPTPTSCGSLCENCDSAYDCYHSDCGDASCTVNSGSCIAFALWNEGGECAEGAGRCCGTMCQIGADCCWDSDCATGSVCCNNMCQLGSCCDNCDCSGSTPHCRKALSDSNSCVECILDSQCDSGEICRNNVCVTTTDTTTCRDSCCVDADCATGSKCCNGVCEVGTCCPGACSGGSSCPASTPYCRTTGTNTCICLSNSTCPGGQNCCNGVCQTGSCGGGGME